MHRQLISTGIIASLLSIPPLFSEELLIAKICPVTLPDNQIHQHLGLLAFSKEWFHSSRSQASYIARDNANGIGIEIHFFAGLNGQLQGRNRAQCDKYRILQTRSSNIQLINERQNQLDAPAENIEPFYDSANLEYGHGTHFTPTDDQDKPWQGQVQRSSTVAIYDTPYITDAYGLEGEDIRIEFETCVVCERDNQFDQILSCGQWGYEREYIGGHTGWTEPEFIPVSCLTTASDNFKNTINFNDSMSYHYWVNWR